MTPRQARAARAMLGLDMKTVCGLAGIGKRTLTEFEAGNRAITNITTAKLRAFYITQGISFDGSFIDAEVVGFGREDTGLAEYSVSPKSKTEHHLLFDAQLIVAELQSLSLIASSIRAKANISSDLIVEVMRVSSLNQKQLAVLLGCSASFISAVSLGKKKLPELMAEKIQSYFDQDMLNVRTALVVETNVTKLLSETGCAIAQSIAEIRERVIAFDR